MRELRDAACVALAEKLVVTLMTCDDRITRSADVGCPIKTISAAARGDISGFAPVGTAGAHVEIKSNGAAGRRTAASCPAGLPPGH